MTELTKLERLEKALEDQEKACEEAWDAGDAAEAEWNVRWDVAWTTAYTRWAEARQALSNYLKEQDND